ncbi:DUF4884 domain-containing protein [Caulobacter sp. 3R27C2-B]|uniref:DUF4884 domain-containing protein n=1 Tax=Caulobacter sp. 3R27C2-B TaxID=2502219 RepID=UPI0010F8D57D|nr:DUF4884 domain-containing protein [Caulobacter sp. 3R27C2-B]
MARIILIAAVAAVLAACAGPSTPADSVDSNAGYAVQKLFKVDGCTVYRFEDAGSLRYLTTCPGSVQSVTSCGKSCTRRDQIQTVEAPAHGE